ncbi:MAG: DNA topoisomerase IB, partial [Armatimonadetes bacterium]|nr:DNA topoisomerase IB [Akkermansiaceae bacterium]
MLITSKTPEGTSIKLIFTSDEMLGYSRVRRGQGFSFKLPDGSFLKSREERKRILSLAVPPAYEKVWICMKPSGHLQATGIDDRGRKQYRYHPAWHEYAADRKFGVLSSFAAMLPDIRKAYRKSLAEAELSRDRVIAGIVFLLDHTGYRIGNSQYEKENKSYGLSTLLTRHIFEHDERLKLRFRGKSGKHHEAEIENPALLKLISELQDLPGQHLFRYADDAGEYHDVGTDEVNQWIKDASGGDFTAKQFRTWKATILCAQMLKSEPPAETKTFRTQALNEAIKATAAQLNHTPATCRKYYIHPTLLRAYEDGSLYKIMNA